MRILIEPNLTRCGFLPEPDPRGRVETAPYNEALEALASFRETHLEFARRYIAAHVRDPRGTGGTPYLEWLSQLIDETRAHMIS